jgi:tRNA threonylcarbamoyladenosine biosynthesis protein TsaB
VITLGIDSTGDPLSVSALDGDDFVHRERAGLREAAAHVLSLVESALGELGVKRADLIAVNVGPGSYTGTRVGVATAQGLARAWDADLVGVDGFLILAERSGVIGTIGAVLDARRSELAAAVVERTDDDTRVTSGPWCESIAKIAERIENADRLVGDGVGLLGKQGAEIELSPAGIATVVLGLREFVKNGSTSPETVLPRYPRDAAREFIKKR